MTTQTTTTAVCDRCDQRADVYVRDGESIDLPFRWVNITRSRSKGDSGADTMDLCINCAESFENWRVPPLAVSA